MAGVDQRTFLEFAKVVLRNRGARDVGKVQATFLRTDPDGTQWVQLAGSSDETPVNGSAFASAQAGDVVELAIDDGMLSISGNATEPSVGMRSAKRVADKAAEVVRTVAVDAVRMAELSRKVADAAQAVADAVNQHFFADTNGVHVTEATQEDWNENHEGANVLINSIGQLFRDGLNNLLTLTTENGARALTVWDGLGNTAENIRAVIGAVIQLGKTGESHAEIDYHSLRLVDRNGTTYFHVSDLRDATGYATITDSFVGDGSTTAFLLSLVPKSIQSVTVDGVAVEYAVSVMTVTLATAAPDGASVNVSYTTFSSSAKAYTLGVRKAGSNIGALSVAEGYDTAASGMLSHAENYDTTASGYQSHAEGYSSTASGYQSHAEGHDTTASGSNSHAEGRKTTASEYASHAEGLMSVASGNASHAQNYGTVAAHDDQTAMGRYNDNDSSHALEVGNGTDDRHRSNAFTVDWNGNVECAGMLRAACTEDTCTVNTSNATIAGNVNYCWHNGVVCTITITVNLKSSLASNSTVAVATAPSGYRPAHAVVGQVYITGQNPAQLQARLTDAGAIVLNNRSGSSVTTSANIYISFTFAL